MILRKPFAILIKYFKLIHAILTVLSFYLLYRTNLMMSFFSEYMGTYNSVIGKDLTGELFNIWIYISLFVIIIGTIIIMGLMLFKKKKIKLYIYNILTYIAVIVIYVVTINVLSKLEIELVDVRTLKVVQDLLTTIFFIQIISFFTLGMRATGFDLKKFDFKKDLQELEIEDDDNEEFEVNIDLSSDETRRKINRAIRHSKYIYKENKVILWILAGLVFSITSLAIYMNLGVYNKLYTKNEAFSTNYFTISLGNSYSSSESYKGAKLLEEESLLMIHLNIKNNFVKERTFESARLNLKIDEHYFKHEPLYSEFLIDIGTTYKKQSITNKFNDYMFIYKVPTDFLNEKLVLVYDDYNGKEIKMRVKPINLDGKKEIKEFSLGQEIDFKESVLNDIKIKLDNVELAHFFKIDYNFCINEATCYLSYEYLRPNINTNYRKAVVKIKGNFVEKSSGDYKKIYSFIKKYGKIEYETLGQTKEVDLNSQLKPIKVNTENECYFELNEEVLNADKIKLIFRIRDKVYKYIVK